METCFVGSFTSFLRDGGDLDGTLGFGSVNSEFTDGGVNSALWLASAFWNIGATCAFILFSNPHPLRNVVRPLLNSQTRTVQVLCDFPSFQRAYLFPSASRGVALLTSTFPNKFRLHSSLITGVIRG